MDVKSYLEKAESIRKDELWSKTDLVKAIGIAINTWENINENPTSCALKTMRKLKKFVDERNDFGKYNSYE